MSKTLRSTRACHCGILTPEGLEGTVLEVRGVSKHFGGIRAISGASCKSAPGRFTPDRSNGAGKTTLFNVVSAPLPDDSGTIRLNAGDQGHIGPHLPSGACARSRSPTCFADFRSTKTCFSRCRPAIRAFNIWRDIDSYADIHTETAELVKFLGLEGIEDIRGAICLMADNGWWILASRSAPSRRCWLLDEPLAGLAAAGASAFSNLVKNVAANIPVLSSNMTSTACSASRRPSP